VACTRAPIATDGEEEDQTQRCGDRCEDRDRGEVAPIPPAPFPPSLFDKGRGIPRFGDWHVLAQNPGRARSV
jgi:hypothetical protein